MDKEKLKKINTAIKEKEKIESILSDLKHYNSDFHDYADGKEHKEKWWAKARKLFSSLYFVVNNKGEVIVEPNTVYGNIIWSPSEIGETEEMKLEVAKSRARILDFMIKETESLLDLAEESFNKLTK